MKMDGAKHLPVLDRRDLRGKTSTMESLYITMSMRHMKIEGVERLPVLDGKNGIETMAGEPSSREKRPGRPSFSWEEFELA